MIPQRAPQQLTPPSDSTAQAPPSVSAMRVAGTLGGTATSGVALSTGGAFAVTVIVGITSPGASIAGCAGAEHARAVEIASTSARRSIEARG